MSAEHENEGTRWSVIVGSGFGAAVTACRLAQAYAETTDDAPPKLPDSSSICVLERGRRYGRDDFPRFKLPDYLTDDPEMRTSRRVPEVSRLLWGIDQGLFDLRNLGKLQVVQAAGYGGGSLIYANVQLQPPPEVFNDWPEAYQGQALDQEFKRVAQWLDVAPLPEGLRDRYPKTQRIREAAKGLDRREIYPPLAIRFPSSDTSDGQGERDNPFGRKQSPCNGCGNCMVGCQEQAKNTLDLNYLAEAERLGVEVRTLSEVLRVESLDGGGTGPRYRVVYFDHLEAMQRSVLATNVFLGAGAVGTTQLLLRSKERNCLKPTPGLSPCGGSGLDHVGKKFFANGDSIGVVFDTERPAEPSHGPTITSMLLHVETPAQPDATHAAVQHARTDRDSRPHHPTWFLIQDGGIAAGLERSLGYFRSPIWMMRNRLTRALSALELRSLSTRSPTLADQGMADVATATAQIAQFFFGRGEHLAQPKPSAIPTEWITFLPQPLRGAFEQAVRASDLARDQTSRIEDSVLDKMGPRTLFLSRLVDQLKLLDQIGDAVSELFPPLRHLLRERRGLDLAASVLAHVLLGDRQQLGHALPLLAMGPDREGMLELHRGRLRARWKRPDVELFGLQERLMRDIAVELGGELRTNPNWTLGQRPITVHAQGGCAMGSVTDETGRVYGFEGLYVVDAAAFPSSVGVNPSSTIAAVAERKVQLFLQEDPVATRRLTDVLSCWESRLQPQGDSDRRRHMQVRIDAKNPQPIVSPPISIRWKERMSGWAIVDGAASGHEEAAKAAKEAAATWVRLSANTDTSEGEAALYLDEELQASFHELERANLRHGKRVVADLQVVIADVDSFVRSFGSEPVKGEVRGTVHLGSAKHDVARGEVRFIFARPFKQERNDGGDREADQRDDLVGLAYDLTLGRDSGGRRLIGRKFFHDDPGQDVWPDLTTLYFALEGDPPCAGVVRIGVQDFLMHQLREMDAYLPGEPGRCPNTGARSASPPQAVPDSRFVPDEAARAWALVRFGQVCFGGIKNVYERWF